MAASFVKSVSKQPHHDRQNICASRAKYREGRRDTAVKVYTVNQESCYLLIQGVPAVGAGQELQYMCEQYGDVADFHSLLEYPGEDFTEAYLVKYTWFPSARSAKKQLDDKSFFGGNLHVCYAPEFESVEETRQKLQGRRKFIAARTKDSTKDSISLSSNMYKKKIGGGGSTESQTSTYIWAGKEYVMSSSSCGAADNNLDDTSCSKPEPSSSTFLPRQLLNSFKKRTVSTESADKEKKIKIENSAYDATIKSIRQKVSNFSAPNVRVSFKRRKKIKT